MPSWTLGASYWMYWIRWKYSYRRYWKHSYWMYWIHWVYQRPAGRPRRPAGCIGAL
ncbi:MULTISPECIES: hypothetical protein [Streptomyces]|uniref:hypothetical protein n=1 Tax=Streptomyces TaxID=1883 RepID=UPI00031FB408|nr:MULTISPECIES: hypothetical protein [Streptomyces]MYT00616.1 hypothetical protein [Streptomyces sp. SID5469]